MEQLDNVIYKRGKKVGEGFRAQVFLYQGVAYKVYQDDYLPEWVEYEIKQNEIITSQTTLKVPKMWGVKEKHVIAMDYLKGESLGYYLLRGDMNLIERLVEIQEHIHEFTCTGMVKIKDRYAHRIYTSNRIDSTTKDLLLNALNQLEDTNQLCHMDFHPFNIIVCHDDDYIIDWVDAGVGNPLLDIARTYLLLLYHANVIADLYLNASTKKTNIKQETIINLLPVIAGARLSESSDPKEINFLMELVDKIK